VTVPPEQLQIQADLEELKSMKLYESKMHPDSSEPAEIDNNNPSKVMFKKPHIPKFINDIMKPILPQSYLMG
jgi:hypothetical protein